MLLSTLLGCNIYISEGRSLQLIRRLEELCKHRCHVALANTFIDQPYNRTGFTLVGTNHQELSSTVAAVVQQALLSLDLQQHAASHPRLGVVDHVSVHPVGPKATLQSAASAARDIGSRLAQPPIKLPVYYYGAAHPEGRELAEIRRRLGYFKAQQLQSAQTPYRAVDSIPQGAKVASLPCSKSDISNHQSGWVGSISHELVSSFPPDDGPLSMSPTSGIVTVGAVPWVVNYNVPLYTDDLAAARAVAKSVSSKGGGLVGVQAMALRHQPGVIEVATNLTQVGATHTNRSQMHSVHDGDSKTSTERRISSTLSQRIQPGAGPAEVQAAVAAVAASQGLPPPGMGYVTNRMPGELMSMAAKLLQFDNDSRIPARSS